MQMRSLPLILSIVTLATSCKKVVFESKEGSEAHYKIEIQKKIGGKLEHVVKNGRVDLLTNEVAYEVAWARDWKESIGKALWYGMQTHRDAGVILIIEQASDEKYLTQLKTTIEYMKANKEIKVMSYPQDFK